MTEDLVKMSQKKGSSGSAQFSVTSEASKLMMISSEWKKVKDEVKKYEWENKNGEIK